MITVAYQNFWDPKKGPKRGGQNSIKKGGQKPIKKGGSKIDEKGG